MSARTGTRTRTRTTTRSAGERSAALGRIVVLLAALVFFGLPLLALLDFSTAVRGGGRTGEAWTSLFDDPAMLDAIVTSLVLAGLTVVGMLLLLLPTMVWVRLRVPGATRLVEFLCLLPLTVPALVLVVGVGNVYSWLTYFFGDTPYVLAFAYVVLVLPYAYRAIDASLSSIDVTTLAEAARSLGAGWVTVVLQVITPNVIPGVLNAALVSVALVLGEYTFASLLNYPTLPVQIVLTAKSDASLSMAASLASILFAAVLLVGISLLDRRRPHRTGGAR